MCVAPRQDVAAGGTSDLGLHANIIFVDARAGSLFGDTWIGNASFSSNLYCNASFPAQADTGSRPSLSSSSSSSSIVSFGRQFPSWVEGSQTDRPGPTGCNRSWTQWQSSGQDTASLIADPLFVGGARPVAPADFELSSKSPALKLGFDPALVTAVVGQVGPSPEWQFDWRPSSCNCPSTFSCGQPGSPTNGSVSGNGAWRCGDLAVWHCATGSVLTGATFATCSAEGWSAPAPTCRAEPPPARGAACLQTQGLTGETDRLPSGFSLHSPRREFFVTQQAGGNLCVYKGGGPSANRGEVWCSGGGPGHGAKNVYTVLQRDGNLCTYDSDSSDSVNHARRPDTASLSGYGDWLRSAGMMWCSGSAVCRSKPCTLWAALGDDGRLCVHRGASCLTTAQPSTAVWCSTKMGQAMNISNHDVVTSGGERAVASD